MAWYRVAYRPEVLQDLAGLDPSQAQRLFDKTKWLASNVGNLRHGDVDPELPGLSKYTVNEWCIFYTVNGVEQVLEVHLIGPRRALYGTRRPDAGNR
jgi:mRNA interferase RelE/StbE